MKELKIFDAVEEVMRMDELQLIHAHKILNWRYLRQALAELREYIAAQQPTPAEDANASPVDKVTVWECDRCKSYNTLTAIACAVCGAIRQPKAPAPHGR